MSPPFARVAKISDLLRDVVLVLRELVGEARHLGRSHPAGCHNHDRHQDNDEDRRGGAPETVALENSHDRVQQEGEQDRQRHRDEYRLCPVQRCNDQNDAAKDTQERQLVELTWHGRSPSLASAPRARPECRRSFGVRGETRRSRSCQGEACLASTMLGVCARLRCARRRRGSVGSACVPLRLLSLPARPCVRLNRCRLGLLELAPSDILDRTGSDRGVADGVLGLCGSRSRVPGGGGDPR